MNHHFGPQWPNPTKRRKRRFRRTDEDAEPAVIMKAMRSITIGNSEQVREYYVQRFTCLQQRLCREISKAFVKTIAPKKQANNPYTGGEEKRPDWWPGPWGPGEKERVRHKEPDHLWKKGWSMFPKCFSENCLANQTLTPRTYRSPHPHLVVGDRASREAAPGYSEGGG